MAVLIRARDVPPELRHDTWRSIVCDTLGPVDLRIDPETPLDGQIDAARLGPLGVARVRTLTPHSVHRTPGLIRRDSPEVYRVALAVSGSLFIVQDEGVAQLQSGQFSVYDFSRPYEVVYDSAVELAVFTVPREMLVVPAQLTAVSIAGESGAAALAVPFLRRVAEDVEIYQPASATRLSAVVIDLLTAALAEHAGQIATVPADTRSRVLLRRIHAFVEQHLRDPGLNPGMVAAAHHVSLRSLHRLFKSEDTTVAAWIRHRRLERCRRDLADPIFFDQPVVTIASRWGLADPAHFSRLFKQAYGMPPAEYRRNRFMPPA